MAIVRRELHEWILADASDLFTFIWTPIDDSPGAHQGRRAQIKSFEEAWPEWARRGEPQSPRLRLECIGYTSYSCHFLLPREGPWRGDPLSDQTSVWFTAKPLADYKSQHDRQQQARREARAIGAGMRRSRASGGKPKRAAL